MSATLACPVVVLMSRYFQARLEDLTHHKLMWKPHTYGKVSGKRVVDKTVRDCKVLVGAKWDVAIAENDWKKIRKEFRGGADITFEKQDILMYTDGGHFSDHIDRNRPKPGRNHIGTLVVIAPMKTKGSSGGDLIIDEKEVVRASKSATRFKFIPLGTPHRVTPVAKGERISLTFGVYESSPPPPPPPPPPLPFRKRRD
jgi:hypothetical protein